MATADQKARNRRTADLLFGLFAELSIVGIALDWSGDGTTTKDAPFGAAISMGALAAAFLLVAAGMLVRSLAARSNRRALLAGLVGVWLAVACLGVMARLASAGVVTWLQLQWASVDAAVLGFGLTRTWDRSRQEHINREVGTL
jgi:hypothetical protein